MRFLHTADWHLGRVLHGVPLLEDQRHVLEQILAVARDERPDFLLVAGDVYDRTVPPADAVDLLGETLERLALDLRTEVHVPADKMSLAYRRLLDDLTKASLGSDAAVGATP